MAFLETKASKTAIVGEPFAASLALQILHVNWSDDHSLQILYGNKEAEEINGCQQITQDWPDYQGL